MNKTVIILGSVALLGVGAYLYFKGKAKTNEETIETDITGTGTTATGTMATDLGTKCLDEGKSPFLQDTDVNCYLK